MRRRDSPTMHRADGSPDITRGPPPPPRHRPGTAPSRRHRHRQRQRQRSPHPAAQSGAGLPAPPHAALMSPISTLLQNPHTFPKSPHFQSPHTLPKSSHTSKIPTHFQNPHTFPKSSHDPKISPPQPRLWCSPCRTCPPAMISPLPEQCTRAERAPALSLILLGGLQAPFLIPNLLLWIFLAPRSPRLPSTHV